MKEILTATEFIAKYGKDVYEKQSNAAQYRMSMLDCYIKYFSFTKEKAIEIYKTLDIDKKYKMMPDYYEHYNIEESAQEFLIKYNNLMSAQRRRNNE